MTVAIYEAAPPRNEYVEDGVATVHAIEFQFFNASETSVKRILVDGTVIALVQPTHYSVAGGAGLSGSITKVSGGVAGATIRIDRNTAHSQELSLLGRDDLPRDALEDEYDRLEMQIQELVRDMVTRDNFAEVLAAVLIAGPGISLSVDLAGGHVTINNSFDAEYIRDAIGAALVAGTGIEIVVNDAGDQIVITNSSQGVGAIPDSVLLSGDQFDGNSGGAGTAAEDIRAIIGLALQGLGCVITVDDAGNTITVDVTQGVTLEVIRDAIGACLVAGSGTTISVNDAGDTITISGDPEFIRDTIGGCLVAGTGVQITVDDAGDTITISSDRLSPTYKGLVPTSRAAAFSFTNAMNGLSSLYTGAAAAATIDPNATTALDAGWTHVIRNKGTGNLTVTPGAGVTLLKSGGTVSASAVIAPGGVATIIRWAADEFTIQGTNVS